MWERLYSAVRAMLAPRPAVPAAKGLKMKIGDTGQPVQLYQTMHGLTVDGVCGPDTYYRWAADNDPTMPWMLASMCRMIGLVNAYSMDIKKQGLHCTDCSGAICRALRITKAPGGPDEINWWLNTDGILTDALGGEHCFDKIEMSELRPGDMVCYGHHDGGVGHIAMVVDAPKHLV